jgi:hypothetical protein
MRSRQPVRRVALLALGTLALGTLALGCEQLDNPGKLTPGSPGVAGTRSAELQRSQLDDVPVPRDMALITRANQSFSYSSGSVRVGRFKYYGSVSVEECVDFYRNTMPLSAYGWTPSNERVERETASLSFVKNADRCDIEIKREGGATTLLVLVNCEALKDQ